MNKSKSYKTLRVFLLFSTTLDGPLAKVRWLCYGSGSPSEDDTPAREGSAITDNEAEETAVGDWEKDTLTGQSHLYSIRIAITDFFVLPFKGRKIVLNFWKALLIMIYFLQLFILTTP